MLQKSIFTLRAHSGPFTVVVEPWACEFPISIGEDCQVVALHPSVLPTFIAEMIGAKLVLWVNEGGATYESWRAGALELAMPVPIPG